MPDPEPQIDFTRIEFPTDRLTVKELRKALPHCFDLPAPEGPHHQREGFFKRESLESYLGGIINAEREVAALAFHTALGQVKPEYHEGTLGPRWEVLEVLISDYTKVGLARGEHHGQELIREIESQAVAQAQRYLGPTPPR
jgi:hypothetical protein